MSERWLPVEGFELRYEISDLGRLRSISRIVNSKGGTREVPSRFMKAKLNESGYLHVGIYDNDGKQKWKFIHGIVASAFHGLKPDGEHIDHINHDKTDNRAVNLRYISVAENQRRKSSTILSAEDVMVIRNLLMGDLTHQQIADAFNVSRETVTVIKSGKIWKGVGVCHADF